MLEDLRAVYQYAQYRDLLSRTYSEAALENAKILVAPEDSVSLQESLRDEIVRIREFLGILGFRH